MEEEPEAAGKSCHWVSPGMSLVLCLAAGEVEMRSSQDEKEQAVIETVEAQLPGEQ